MNMGKFFKVLGIGSAIGAVVYGVIKYKHDEKFKEQVKEVHDKALDKTCDFVVNHPKAALGIIVGGAIGGSALAGAVVSKGLHKHMSKTLTVEAERQIVGKELEFIKKEWNKAGLEDDYRAVQDFIDGSDFHSGVDYVFGSFVNENNQLETYLTQIFGLGDSAYRYKESKVDGNWSDE